MLHDLVPLRLQWLTFPLFLTTNVPSKFHPLLYKEVKGKGGASR